MKILFPFVGDSVGGSHLSSLNLCKTLKANNYEVVVLLHNINEIGRASCRERV